MIGVGTVLALWGRSPGGVKLKGVGLASWGLLCEGVVCLGTGQSLVADQQKNLFQAESPDVADAFAPEKAANFNCAKLTTAAPLTFVQPTSCFQHSQKKWSRYKPAR